MVPHPPVVLPRPPGGCFCPVSPAHTPRHPLGRPLWPPAGGDKPRPYVMRLSLQGPPGRSRAGVGTRPYRPGPFAVCWCPAPCFPVGADAHIGPPLRPGAESGRGQAPPLRPSDARQPAGNEIPDVGAAKTVLGTAETFGRFFRLIDSRGKFKVSLRTCHCFVMPSPAACGTMVNAIQSPIFREEQT